MGCMCCLEYTAVVAQLVFYVLSYASRPVLTPVLESTAARAFSDRHNIVLSCQQSPALPASVQQSLQAKDD